MNKKKEKNGLNNIFTQHFYQEQDVTQGQLLSKVKLV